jgi:hypothetical protein
LILVLSCSGFSSFIQRFKSVSLSINAGQYSAIRRSADFSPGIFRRY